MGRGAQVSTAYEDYRRVQGVWIAHRVTRTVTKRKEGKQVEFTLVPFTDTVVSVGPAQPPGEFQPLELGGDRWARFSVIQGLTATGWTGLHVWGRETLEHGGMQWTIQELSPPNLHGEDLPMQYVTGFLPHEEPAVLRELRAFVHGPNFIPIHMESER